MLISAKTSNGYSTTSEIGELVEAFERCVLPRERWTHAAWLTVALWYLHQNPPSKTRRLMRNSIKRYDFEHNIAARDPNGYHETLTVFWLAAVNGYLRRYGKIHSLVEMANGLMERFADRNLPLRIYSRELLHSPKAKRFWVEPDKFTKNKKSRGQIIL